MKKFLLFSVIAAAAIPAMAALSGDGYYRVQNALTKRYAYLLDNKGDYSVSTTSADVNALHLYSGFVRASSDPSTVFYIENAGGNYHDIAGQGTSLHSFLDTYLQILEGKVYDDQQSYYAYASKSGMTKYLGDVWDDYDGEEGLPSVDAKTDNRLWYIIPLSSDNDWGYFGIAPSVTADGKYYHPFYADFSVGASSAGVKFYTIVKVDSRRGVVVKREVSGAVPASVPVIVECENPLSSDNRLDVGASETGDVSGNLLRGTYFNNDEPGHVNQRPFDSTTMRVLASEGGRLVFTTASYEYVPRNEAYLELSPEDTGVSTYTVVSEAEYEEMSGVEGIVEENASVDVYGIDGALVKSGISKSEVPSLGKGVYILRAGDAVEKVILH